MSLTINGVRFSDAVKELNEAKRFAIVIGKEVRTNETTGMQFGSLLIQSPINLPVFTTTGQTKLKKIRKSMAVSMDEYEDATEGELVPGVFKQVQLPKPREFEAFDSKGKAYTAKTVYDYIFVPETSAGRIREYIPDSLSTGESRREEEKIPAEAGSNILEEETAEK